MAGAQARAVVAMEIFIKQRIVAKVRIGLVLLVSTKDRPPALIVAQEQPRKRRESWAATSPKCMRTPEPVGNSTVNSSPK